MKSRILQAVFKQQFLSQFLLLLKKELLCFISSLVRLNLSEARLISFLPPMVFILQFQGFLVSLKFQKFDPP